MPLCFFCCTIVLVSGYGLAAPLFPTIENKKTFCADFTDINFGWTCLTFEGDHSCYWQASIGRWMNQSSYCNQARFGETSTKWFKENETFKTLSLVKFIFLQVEILLNMAAPEVLSKWCPNYTPCEILFYLLAILVIFMYNLLNYWRWKHKKSEASVIISLTEYYKLLSKIQLLETERERAVMDKSTAFEKKLLTDRTIADVLKNLKSLEEVAKILYKEQTSSNEVIKQKDSIISGLTRDMNALQKWMAGFCEGKIIDLQTIFNDCNICTIGSVIQKANDQNNKLHNVMKELEVQLKESKDYCNKTDIRLETVIESYAEKEQSNIYKEEREEYLEQSNQQLKDEVSALHNQVKELELNYVTRLNKTVKTTNEIFTSLHGLENELWQKSSEITQCHKRIAELELAAQTDFSDKTTNLRRESTKDKCPSKATKIGEVTVFPDLQEVRITIEVDNVASSYSNTSRINCETVKAWEKSKTSKFGNTPRPAKLPSRSATLSPSSPKICERSTNRKRGIKADPDKSLWRKLMANSVRFAKPSSKPHIKETIKEKANLTKWKHLINEPRPPTPVVPPLTESSVGIIRLALPRLQQRQRVSKESSLSLIFEL